MHSEQFLDKLVKRKKLVIFLMTPWLDSRKSDFSLPLNSSGIHGQAAKPIYCLLSAVQLPLG